MSGRQSSNWTYKRYAFLLLGLLSLAYLLAGSLCLSDRNEPGISAPNVSFTMDASPPPAVSGIAATRGLPASDSLGKPDAARARQYPEDWYRQRLEAKLVSWLARANTACQPEQLPNDEILKIQRDAEQGLINLAYDVEDGRIQNGSKEFMEVQDSIVFGASNRVRALLSDRPLTHQCRAMLGIEAQ